MPSPTSFPRPFSIARVRGEAWPDSSRRSAAPTLRSPGPDWRGASRTASSCLDNGMVVRRRWGDVAGKGVAEQGCMAQTLLTFSIRLISGKTVYRARACGRERADGTWEGWIEFVPEAGGSVLASERETTQP